jgi:hypothetical protein
MVFMLIHSPLVGPFTWSLVAEELRARGQEMFVPTLSRFVSLVGPNYVPDISVGVNPILLPVAVRYPPFDEANQPLP